MFPVYDMNHYLIATHIHRDHSGPDPVFRAISPPHGGVVPSTFSKWISEVIRRSGYTGSGNTGHTTRGKSTSKSLLFPGLTIQQIMHQAEWKSESTFRNFYHAPHSYSDFGKSVLNLGQNPEVKE